MFGKKKGCTPGRKRFAISVLLGIAFGFFCAYLASRTSVAAFWWTPTMWTIVTDRFLIGLVVAMSGAYVIHPIFRFRCPAAVRGTIMGAIVSLPLATGAMIAPAANFAAWPMFWVTVGAGAIYGFVIDLVATHVAGEGDALLK